MLLKGRLEVDFFAVALEANAAAQKLAVQNGARGRDRGATGNGASDMKAGGYGASDPRSVDPVATNLKATGNSASDMKAGGYGTAIRDPLTRSQLI